MDNKINKKPLNIIVSGLETLNSIIDRFNEATSSFDERMPELEKKDRFERIKDCTVMILIVVVLIISFIINDATDNDALYYSSFFIIFLCIFLTLIYAKYIDKKYKNRTSIKFIKEENESAKQIALAIEDQRVSCLKLLDVKNDLLDSRIIKDRNGYNLEYSYTEDGDNVICKYIYIDTIETSLKQTGASLVISEDKAWKKEYNMKLYIEYNLFKEINKA